MKAPHPGGDRCRILGSTQPPARLVIHAEEVVDSCVRPSRTRYDGEAAFAVSCGDREGDPDASGEAALVATGRAIEAAIRSA